MELNTRLIRRNDIMTADMGGSAVTMDMMSGKYYNLGEIGGAIWNLIETEKSIDEIVLALLSEYDVSREQCVKDITPFLEELIEKGLAHIC